MNTTIYAIGQGFVIVCGLAILAAMLVGISYIIGSILNTIRKDLTKIYDFYSLKYWFERLEKEGTHCFKKIGKNTTK